MRQRRKYTWKAKLEFNPRGLWIGFYWKFDPFENYSVRKLHIYICLLPMFPLHITGSTWW